MPMLQTYETSIKSDVSEHCFLAIVVPRRSLRRKRERDDVLAGLRCDPLTDLSTNACNLMAHLAMLLSIFRDRTELRLEELKHLMRFAEHVATDPIIPIEGPELNFISLRKLLQGGRGKSWYVARLVVYRQDETPFLLLSVKAGIILCGDGQSLGDAVDSGLGCDLWSWLRD